MKELTDEEIEMASTEAFKNETISPDVEPDYAYGYESGFYTGFESGAKFARDRQKEIDREEIERLKEEIQKMKSYLR